MLDLVYREFSAEVAIIEARTQQILKKRDSGSFSPYKIPPKKDERLWLPALCLLSAGTAKDTNTKVVHLASAMNIFSMASSLHESLPDDYTGDELKEKIQFPILYGDLLYCCVCAELCRYDLHHYIGTMASIITSVNKDLALKDLNKDDQAAALKTDLAIRAIEGEYACYLGSHSVIGNNYITEVLKSLGYHLGLLKAVWDRELDCLPYIDHWYKAWSLLDILPRGREHEIFRHILLNMGGKWQLTQKPVILRELNA